MKQWKEIFFSAAKSWNADNVFKHAAAVSFYTLFSIAPIILIAITVVGFFFGKENATAELTKQVTALVGPASAELLQAAAQASETKGTSMVSTLTGVALLLLGATSVFGQLQQSFNEIWCVRTKPSKSGWALLIVQRLVSLSLVLTIGFLLLVSLVLTTALSTTIGHFSHAVGGSSALLTAADIIVSIVVITILFALLFKVLPDVRLRWRDVWMGAIITALLFTLGRYLIALYLGHSAVASIYGAAGSLVALLIWVYYSCAILFFGIEFTRAYRLAHHLKLEPKVTAVVVREAVVESPRRHAPAAK